MTGYYIIRLKYNIVYNNFLLGNFKNEKFLLIKM